VNDLLARHFPIRVGRALLEVLSSRVVEGEGLVADLRLTIFEGEVPESIKEQSVRLGAADATHVEAMVAWSAERMAKADVEFMFPHDIVRAPAPFVRVAATTDAYWTDAVRESIREQALARGFEQRFDVLGDWPVPARTVYFLDLANAMLGGNGLEVFLGQCAPEDAIGMLAALDEGGCAQLAQRFREALGLIDEQNGELTSYVSEDWLARERRDPPEAARSSWRAIDSWEPGGTYALMKEELAPAIDRYVTRHRSGLVL
jgi:hypothetical protein